MVLLDETSNLINDYERFIMSLYFFEHCMIYVFADQSHWSYKLVPSLDYANLMLRYRHTNKLRYDEYY